MTSPHSHLDEAEQIVRDHFGIAGTATALGGYGDTNTRIDTVGGARYVLRVSAAGADPEHLLQIDNVMVAVSTASFATPRPVPTSRNLPLARLANGQIAQLHTWVHGATYAASGHPRASAGSIGRTAGEMVRILADFEQQPVGAESRWDLRSAPATIAALRSHVRTERQQSLIQQVLDRLIRIETEDLPLQMVHNDLNPGNLLLSDNAVAGVIDFQDATMTYRIAELAIACAYAMLDQDDPVLVATEACRGYLEFTPIAEAEATYLMDLILTRLATSVCIAASQPEGNPEHHNTETAVWNLLARLIYGDTDDIAREIARAAGSDVEWTKPDPTHALRDILGPSLSLSYQQPISMAFGEAQYLFDTRGRKYLDCVNNVAHVGHTNPHVVAAAATQMHILNTNTRYLHPGILKYAKRLVDTLPASLDTVFLVNSGSEANELALRLARTATRRHDIVCVDDAYHGNTTTLTDISPYKFKGPGGDGQRSWVHVLPSMDPYRHPRFDGPDAGANYFAAATEHLGTCEPAALIVEALPGCGGQLVPATGVLKAAYDSVRALGGLVIADEVQTGLGRVGSAFWAFELEGVDPDIVTIGKPAGNGHPLAGVVTTRSVAMSFDNGLEYFNTFGGNPVSAAVGNAVLDVVEGEELQRNALVVGEALIADVLELSLTYTSIGDVRGAGLFIGIEIVLDRDSKEPAPDLARDVVEFAKEHGVLLSIDGPHHNVIKIKPPMMFTTDDAVLVVSTLRSALSSVGTDQ